MKKVNVVFIPYYIKKSFELANIDLLDLEDYVSVNKFNYKSYLTDLNRKKSILKNLSNRDVLDLIIANDIISSKLNATANSISNITDAAREDSYQYINETNINDFYNLLIDYNIPHKDSYELIMGRGTVFVILKNGFTNFIVLDNSDDKLFFIKTILDFLFRYFEYFEVIKTSYFINFIELQFKNKHLRKQI